MTGASSGIGFELAKQFSQHGFDLLITADSDGIQTAAREIEALGTHVQSVQSNLVAHDGVHQLQSAGRHIDAIAINAGFGLSGRFDQTDLETEMNMVRLNVLSAVHLAKYIVKEMVARGSGRILFTSSIAGTMPTPMRRFTRPPKHSCALFLKVFAKS